MNCCNWYGCFLKTNAFIVALLSIAVLTFSTTVLISAVSYDPEKYNNSTDEYQFPLGGEQDDENGLDYNVTNDSEKIGNVTKLETNPLYISTTDEGDDAGNRTTDTNTNPAFTHPLSRKGDDDDSTLLSSSQPVLSRATLHSNGTYAGEEDADGGGNSNQMSTTESSTTTTIPPPKEQDAFFDKHFNFWKGKSDTYITLIKASSGTGIFAGFLQLAFSWLLICGSTKELKERKKLWNLSNLIVFILLVVIILVPLSYNNTTNTFKGSKAFMKEIYRRIRSLEEFSVETLEGMWNSVSNFSKGDLTLFYYVLGADGLVLLGFLVPPLLCCLCYPCTRCCCKRKSTRTDSDLMLFPPNEPF